VTKQLGSTSDILERRNWCTSSKKKKKKNKNKEKKKKKKQKKKNWEN